MKRRVWSVRGEWRDQRSGARVNGEWGEPSGEWGEGEKWRVASLLRGSFDLASPRSGLATPPSPLGSLHSPLTTRFSPLPTHPRHSPLVSPLPTHAPHTSPLVNANQLHCMHYLWRLLVD